MIGEIYNMNGRNVQRYIRLSYLIPELQKLVDESKIGMVTGVELSYLSEKEQRDVWDEMELTAFEHYQVRLKLSRCGNSPRQGRWIWSNS